MVPSGLVKGWGMEPNRTSLGDVNRLSRYLRILLSVVVSAYAAQVFLFLMDAAVTPSAAEHYLRRLAAPIFVMAFIWPVALAFLLVASLVLHIADGRARRRPMPTGRQSAAVFAVLAAGASVFLIVSHSVGPAIVQLGIRLGAFLLLFLAIYWLMTGRLMGRPGWSLSRFSGAGWGEWAYLATAIFVLVQLVSIVVPVASFHAGGGVSAEPGTPPFRVRHEREMTRDVMAALHKFPDPQSCLEPGADARLREDIVRMDWDRIVSDGDARVCIFRLLHEWGGVAEAADWLREQGFAVGANFSSDRPHVERDGSLRVTGAWFVNRNGPRFPTTGFARRILAAIPYSMSVDATYSPDGKTLRFVSIAYTTL